jgi:hypothetical protein
MGSGLPADRTLKSTPEHRPETLELRIVSETDEFDIPVPLPGRFDRIQILRRAVVQGVPAGNHDLIAKGSQLANAGGKEGTLVRTETHDRSDVVHPGLLGGHIVRCRARLKKFG